MAVYDLEEQQKIDDLKAWWNQYGTHVVTAIIVASLIVIGVQGWRWYQRSQSEASATLYGAVTQAVAANDAAKAKDAAAQLQANYARSGYTPRAALLVAKLLFDGNDKAGARRELQWVIDSAAEDELKQLARYRLAQVLFDEKSYDEALRALDGKHDDSYEGMYADLRGDILLAAGKPAEAKAAYQASLAKLDARSSLRGLVQVKHDAIGDAQ